MKKLSTVTMLAATFACAGSLSAPASADAAAVCDGTDNASRVGAIVVEADSTCYLTGTWVQGGVTVEAGGTLVTEGVRVMGNVTMKENSMLSAADSHFVGGIYSTGNIVDIQDSRVVGSVTRNGESDYDSGTINYLENTNVLGLYATTGGSTFIDGGRIFSSVHIKDGDYADVYNTNVGGSVFVSRMATGSTLCGTTVSGEAKFVGNKDGDATSAVVIGPTSERGLCNGVTNVARGAELSGNGTVEVSEFETAGHLSGQGNAKIAVFGPNVTVGGEQRGQFAGLTADDAQARVAAAENTSRADVLAQLAAKRAEAKKAAAEAGEAFNG